MRLRYDRVELYRDGAALASVVALVTVEGALSADEMALAAAALGASRTVFVMPPRRDDCDLRARIFTPLRELPRAAEATLAIAAVRGAAVRVEEGVTRAEAWPAGDGFEADTPPPVLGHKDVDARELAAAAVGLDASALDPARPVLAASCGPNVLVLPVRDEASLRRARLDPAAWQRTVEKARHHGAVLVHAPPGGDTVEVRCFAAEGGGVEEWGNGLAATAAARYLQALRGAAPGGTWRFVFGGDGPRRGALTVRETPAGWRVEARANTVGRGEFVR